MNMSSTETFNLAAKFIVTADGGIIENSEAVDNCGRMTDLFDKIIRIKV
jgi:hypothetical protein